MNKKIHFISGLPRSGNTLLASILNENPNITATGHSFIPDMFYYLKYAEQNSQTFKNYPDINNLNYVYKNIIGNYYYNYKTKFVIERGDWITPYNFNILQQFCPNEIKIVILVRDVLEIIKSYLKICRDNPNFYINYRYNLLDKTTLYKNEIENKVDIIMEKGGYVDTILYSIKWLKDKNLLKNFILIDYKDLVSNTKEILNKIYEYYDMPIFKHSFKKLKQIPIYNDKVLNAPIHKINIKGIKEQKNDIELNQRIIDTYKNLEFWK
jgi:sulfotransferase